MFEAEHSVFEKEMWVRARRDHYCLECEGVIPKGARHWSIVWMSWSAVANKEVIHSVRLCHNCYRDWQVYMQVVHYDEDYCYGFLADAVETLLSDGRIGKDDPLVHNWLPHLFRQMPLTIGDGQMHLFFYQ